MRTTIKTNSKLNNNIELSESTVDDITEYVYTNFLIIGKKIHNRDNVIHNIVANMKENNKITNCIVLTHTPKLDYSDFTNKNNIYDFNE